MNHSETKLEQSCNSRSRLQSGTARVITGPCEHNHIIETIPALPGGPSAARGEPEQGPVALKDQAMAAVSTDGRKCGGALGLRRNGGGPCDALYVEIILRRGPAAALVPAYSGGTAGDGPQKPGKSVQQISTKKGIDNPGKTCIIHIVADAMRHLKPDAERCRRQSKDRLA